MLSVKKGWQGFKEVDRVVYDPARITIKEMEKILKESGTYVGTISKNEPDDD